MVKKKITTRTCGKCKKVFPVGQGHNARTCGKPRTSLSKPKKHTISNRDFKNNAKAKTQLKGKLEEVSNVTPQGLPRHSFLFVTHQRGKVLILKLIPNGTLKEFLPKKYAEKYSYAADDRKKLWFNHNGELHRLDGPAIEFTNGDKEWWVEGTLHREDGPAVERTNGNKEWWVEGKLHRKGVPAVERVNGHKEWWVEGKRHRLDGPALERTNGDKEWWMNGGLHRLDGPAVEYADGGEEWWVDGKRHRLDGPAVVLSNGSKEWWVNGKLHRLDGPAVECANGDKEWWVNGLNMETFANSSDIPEIMGEYFYLLCTNKNPTIHKKAISNPNCPPAWKVAGQLM